VKLLGLLIWLRFRLAVNACRTFTGTVDRVLAVITMVAIVMIALGLGIVALIIGVLTSDSTPEFLHVVLGIPWIAWFAAPHIKGKVGGTDVFELKRLVVLPLSLQKTAFWNLVATLIDPVVLFCVPACAGYALGTLIKAPALGLMYLVSLIVYAAFGAVLFRFNGTLNLVKGGALMVVAKVMATTVLLALVPFLWISGGMVAAAHGNVLWWVVSIAAATLLTTFLGILEIRFSVRAAGQPDTKGPPPRPSRGPGILGRGIEPLIGKEIISLRRQHLFLGPMIVTVLTALVFVCVEIVRHEIITISPRAWTVTILVLTGVGCLGWFENARNTWAADGAGVRCLFTLPYPVVSLYRRKACAGLVLFTIWYVITLVTSLIACRPGLVDVVMVTVVAYAVVLYIFGAGSMISAWFAHPPSSRLGGRGMARNYVANWVFNLIFIPYFLIIIVTVVLLLGSGQSRAIGMIFAASALAVAIAAFWFFPLIAARHRDGTPELICEQLELDK